MSSSEKKTPDVPSPPAAKVAVSPPVPWSVVPPGRAPSWRLTLAVVLGCALLYMPFMGSYGLFDPWETHYGEVARQILERNDIITMWWQNARDGRGPDARAETTFFSKPCYTFWLEAVSLRVFGLGRSASDAEIALSPWTAVAIRMPAVLCGILGLLGVFLAIARIFGRRAGLLATAVLASTPMYFLISRQAMTDMPYVGPMTAGICFLMLAIFDQGRPLRRTQLRLGKRRIPWPHDWAFYLFLAIFALAVLPPLLLMTRQLGSFVIAPLKARVYGYVAFIPYYVLFAGCILAFAWTRSTRQLYLYGLYLTVGAATLAKGFVATGIVGIVVLSYLLVSNEWRLLARVELWRGAMIYVAACFPWWEANVIRHGLEFWNSLMGTEQVRRLLRGEQGHAKGPFEFYVRQFGWGGLPWSALVPVAFANAEFDIRGQGTEERQRRALRFVGLWLIATFVLFQLTITKYNHYILPCMPPAAILVGVYLDRILAGRARGLLLAVAISLGFFVFIARDMVTAPVRFVHFFTYLYTGIWADGVDRNPLLTTLVVLIGVAMALFAVGKLRRYAVPAAVVLSLAFTFVTLNRIIPQAAKNWSQQDMFRAYYQKRGSPSEDVIAWRLNWRGETFYSKANAIIFIDQPADKFRTYLAGKAKGTKVWLVTEKGNQNGLRDALPAGTARDTFRVEHSSIHFLLASAVL